MSNPLCPLPGSPRRAWRKLISRLALICGVGVALLYAFQDHFLYHPVRYDRDWRSLATTDTVKLTYRVYSRGQTWINSSFYVPPLALSKTHHRLWVLFAGNRSLTLSWMDLVKQKRRTDPSAAFLLIEYPGYGLNEGHPQPDTILVSAERAYSALAAMLHTTTRTLDEDVSTLGYSLGCAAALQFAAHHPVRRAVLAAPFTSTLEMARRRAGWPLCYLLRDRFDNRARLKELLSRSNPPTVVIVHGDADRIVPTDMGRALAALSDRIIYHELKGIDHVSIPVTGPDGLLSAMDSQQTINRS